MYAVTVTEPLEPGTVLDPAQLTVVRVPAIEGVKLPSDPARLVGHIVAERLLPGEPVRAERLVAPSDVGDGPEALVPRGMRWVPVPVPPASLLGVEPGDYVDLIETEGGSVAAVALQVMATSAPAGGAPEDEAFLAVAAVYPLDRQGYVPVLRNPIDITRVDTHGAVDIGACPTAGPVAAVARRNLYPAVPLDPSDLQDCSAPPGPNAGAAIDLVGRSPAERILAGEWIHPERLFDPERLPAGVEAAVPRGMVGLAVAAETTAHVGAADYVDVLEPGAPGILAQAVFVLAVEPGAALLLLTPDQALRLAPASAARPLRLALRNDLDVQLVEPRAPPPAR